MPIYPSNRLWFASSNSGSGPRVQQDLKPGFHVARPAVTAPFSDFQTNCLDFNGEDSGGDEGIWTGDVTLGITQNLSMVAWVKVESVEADSRPIWWCISSGVSNANRCSIGVNSSQQAAWARYDSSSALNLDVVWDTALTVGQWHMISFSDSGAGSFVAYLDGQVATVTGTDNSFTGTDTVRDCAIGGQLNNNNPPTAMIDSFPGRIMSVASWSSILTAAEHLYLYNSGWGGELDLTTDRGDYVSQATNEHWWRCGHAASPNLGDDSGNGTARNLSSAFNITDADRVADVPVGTTSG